MASAAAANFPIQHSKKQQQQQQNVSYATLNNNKNPKYPNSQSEQFRTSSKKQREAQKLLTSIER